MATVAAEPPVLTTGDIQRRTGAPIWAVRRVVDRLFPGAPRIGPYRVVMPSQFASVAEALKPYLPQDAPGGGGAA